MENQKTTAKILEVRDHKDSIDLLLETESSPSGVSVNKKDLGDYSRHLQVDNQLVVETRGPLSIAGSKFIGLYLQGETKPFYKNN